MGEERQVLAAMALMEEVISDQCQLKLKGNQDTDSITELAVLEINETGDIRELYRLVCEIPENQNGIEAKTDQETESGRDAMGGIQEVNSACQIDQLNDLRFEMQSAKFNLSRSKSEKISENEMPCMRKEIPKEETYDKYGTLLGELELSLLGNMGHWRECFSRKFRMESLIFGRFDYAMTNKPISAGHTKTGAYVGEDRKLEAVFRVKRFQEFVETHASAPTVQLQIIRLLLAVIGYRKWNFRAIGVSGEFPRSGALKRDAYAKLPDGGEKDNVAWQLLKPMYGLSAACTDWCKTIRDFLANERVGEVDSLDKSVFF